MPRAESLTIGEVTERLVVLISSELGSHATSITADMLHRELVSVAQATPISMTEAGMQEEGFEGFSGEDPAQERADELGGVAHGAGSAALGRGTRQDPFVMPPQGTVPLSEFRTRKGLEARVQSCVVFDY